MLGSWSRHEDVDGIVRLRYDPPGGHGFSMRVKRGTLERDDTPEQRDSWNRTWTFFEWNLRPYVDKSKAETTQ